MDPFSAMGLTFGIAGLGAQVVGGIMGMNDQDKLMRAQSAQDRMLAQRDRLQQVRQLLSTSATVTQTGENTGVGSSSGVSGGRATAYGQAGQNINYINSQEMYGMVQTKDRQAIARDKSIMDAGQGLQNIGKDIFDMAGPLSQGAI